MSNNNEINEGKSGGRMRAAILVVALGLGRFVLGKAPPASQGGQPSAHD
jgi:hypothetical protein